MFRDREEALEALEKQLLEEDTEEEEVLEETLEEDEARAPAIYDFDAEEAAEEEDLPEELYDTRRKTGLSLWLLILAFLILAIAVLLAKKEGLI